MKTFLGYVTHQKGSWKWQDRFELAEYRLVWSKCAKCFIYKKIRTIDDKVKPRHCGPLGIGHNRPASAEHVMAVLFGI